jgi:hypothetical protein
MNKLVRQLRRELTNNPKKSALLGGGLLLAIYFWAPLVYGWIAKPGSPRPQKAANESSEVVVSSRSASGGAPVETLLPADWRELARRVEEDPLRNLAGLATPQRDPFAWRAGPAIQPAAQGEFGATPGGQTAAPRISTGLNLKLEAILIGGRNRTAIINGGMYREQEPIGPPDAAAGERPRVLEIHADHVKIGWGDETLRLELERAALAPGDRIVPLSTADEDASSHG